MGKMYSVDVVDQGCPTCGVGKLYAVVSNGLEESVHFEDQDEAEHLVDILNAAYERGLADASTRSPL